MAYSRQPISIAVMQLGELNRSEAENSIGLANQAQRAFRFEFLPERLPLSRKLYQLSNSGYDLELAIIHLSKNRDLPKPVILLTSVAFSERGKGKMSDWFYFTDFDSLAMPSISIISTYIWEKILGHRQLQPYILSCLASFIFSHYALMEFHDDKHGCLLDYCFEFEDLESIFKSEGLCIRCERDLEERLRRGDITLEQSAAAIRLFNRACNRRVCFMVMPFNKTLKPVYRVVSQALRADGWIVQRADEIVRPRRITDAIMQAILISDLVVADLTGSNPNVFYELGLAHATGCDVILLTQERRIPFDVTTESTIFYKAHKKGLEALAQQLHRLAAHGVA